MASLYEILQWRQLSRNDQIMALTDPFSTHDMNVRFQNKALAKKLLGQREADEKQAGRNFRNALEWIEYTEATKGEASGQRFEVEVVGRYGKQHVLYTQTREYHMTGGEKPIEEADGAQGCERVIGRGGNYAVYDVDFRRAGAFQAVVALVKAEQEREQLSSSNASPQSNRSPAGPPTFQIAGVGVHKAGRSVPGFPASEHIRLPGSGASMSGVRQTHLQEWKGLSLRRPRANAQLDMSTR